MDILSELKKRILICDGGMGSLLQSAGLRPGERPETWNLLHPEIVRGFHLDYLKAGADIIAANTFGASCFHFPEGGEFGALELIAAGIRCARSAVEEAGHGFAALDLGPSGKLLRPLGDLSFEDCVRGFSEVVREGVKAGADLVLIETMSDLREVKAAVLAAKEQSSLPVMATVTLDADGRLLTGGTVETVTALLEGLGVDALGLNCSLDPVQMLPIARRFVEASKVPVIINPNAGLPRMEEGKTVYDVGPEQFAQGMKEIMKLGVSIAGGCCGTTPAHIALVAEAAKGFGAPERQKKDAQVICSAARLITLGDAAVRTGECLPAKDRDSLKEELLEGDYESVVENALDLKDEGAEILLIETGLKPEEETEVLPALIEELQMAVDLPLAIRTDCPEAMEAALRVSNGRPLVERISESGDGREALRRLAEKYGAVIRS